MQCSDLKKLMHSQCKTQNCYFKRWFRFHIAKNEKRADGNNSADHKQLLLERMYIQGLLLINHFGGQRKNGFLPLDLDSQRLIRLGLLLTSSMR